MMRGTHKSQTTIKKVVSLLVAILLAFVVGSVFMLCIGKQPLQAFYWLFMGAFGSVGQISATLNKMALFVLCGLSCAVAFKCGLINIGAQGQMIMGALGSCAIGLLCGHMHPVIVMILAVAAGIICGGLWALVAGALKVYFCASEVITTVMLNYIAILFVEYMTNGPLKDPSGAGAQTELLNNHLWLGGLIPGTKIHVGIIIAIVLVIVFGLFFKYARTGFAIKVTGFNPVAAIHSGIEVKKTQLLSMAICGALAGFAGFLEVFGTQHQLISGFATDYGFDGIAVALLGQGHPVGMILSGLLFGAMKTGGTQMQMFGGVPYAMVRMIQGLMIIFVLIGPTITWFKRRAKV